MNTMKGLQTCTLLVLQFELVNHGNDMASSVIFINGLPSNLLFGLVVKASASRAEGPGFESRLSRDFFGVESYQ